MPEFLRLTWSRGGAALAAAALCLCAASASPAQDRAKVVAVTYALHYMADRLLGAHADVAFPVPEGTDPSFWRPKISDISAIQSADLILLNGAGFAAWIDRVSLPRSKTVNTSAGFADRYIATDTVTHSHGDGGEHSHEGTASYLWLDPALAALQAEAIAAAAVSRGLAPEAEVGAKLAALIAELETLEAEARGALADLSGTVMIATHPRYQYLARAYDLDIRALEWEAGAAPSEDDLAALAARVAESGARVLIWEAAPPAGALEQTAALGLANVIFPPMARGGDEEGMIAALQRSVTALSMAARRGQ